MIVRPFYLSCLAHASYLIGDADSGTAWVIDPQRDIRIYLDAARADGLRITDVVLTHIHADFVAGHMQLASTTGARIHLGPGSGATFDHVVAHDGDEHGLGRVRLRILHTPGHTPEGISVVAHDDALPGSPAVAVFTGDTLFVGDVGRPDLLASVGHDAADLAGQLQTSLQKLLQLPDTCVVYPAHGAGSLCGRHLGAENQSTIGAERRSNYALQPMSRADFIAAVTADQPSTPAYFAHDVATNRSGPAVISESSVPRLTQTTMPIGSVQLLDVREARAFAGAHMRGSIHIGLRGAFATWAGAVLDPAGAVVIVTDSQAEADEAAMRLRRIGLDRVAGWRTLADANADEWHESRRIEVEALRQDLAGAQPPMIIDVRQSAEFERGHIPGARSMPLAELPRRLSELPRESRMVVHCAGGYRSSVAASLLRRSGFLAEDLIGGFQAWQRVVGAASPATCTTAS